MPSCRIFDIDTPVVPGNRPVRDVREIGLPLVDTDLLISGSLPV